MKIRIKNKQSTMCFIKYYLFLTFLIVSVLPINAQGILTFDVQSFREESDSLRVDYQLWIPKQLVESGRGLRISPMVQAGDSLLLLPCITILGKNKQKVLERYHHNRDLGYSPVSLAPNDSLTPYNYSMCVPYRLWMDSARFCMRQEVAGYRGRKVITCYLLPAKVELEAKEPYKVQSRAAFIVPPKEEKHRKFQGEVFLEFQVILPNFRRNPEELVKIDDVVREVVTNKDAVLNGLYVEGYASPDGLYATNERLSGERAMALKKYIKDKFSLSDNLFKVSSVAEDWDGLAELVSAGDIPQKDRILEIIATIGIRDGREAALMHLGAPYRQMLREMFPRLRRVEYQIDYTVRDYDPEEVQSIINSKPQDLSEKELYDLAFSYGRDNKQYDRILLEVIPKCFPDSPSALNNAAAILLENGELSTAKRYLNKAGESSAAINNRGVLCLLEGDLDKAEEYFNRAADAGNKEAVYNNKEAALKRTDNKKMQRYKNRK